MIVKKGKSHKFKNNFNHGTGFTFLFRLVLAIGLLSILYYSYNHIQANKKSTTPNIIICDAEHIEGPNFVTNGVIFNNSKTRSSDQSYEGRYSSKLDESHKYGFSLKIKTVEPNQKYIATVRRYIELNGRFSLAISPSPAKELYVQTIESISKDKNGWELLRVEITIPNDGSVKELTIFPYRSGDKGVAYFDNLRVEAISQGSEFGGTTDEVQLYLDQKALSKINSKRDEALRNGVLISADDDWVKAKLIDSSSVSHNIKLRLKGDWTDHLQGDYWSYRIKMPSDKSWDRMQTFSFQDPKARSYLDEWFYHKVLEELDIITPRYGFIKLSQNDQSPVLYAYEEHFEKQIAEYKNRREGVIVKFAENHMWDDRLRNNNSTNDNIHQNTVFNSEIRAFKESKMLKTPKLKEQFMRAQDLMNSYKNQSSPPSEIFDIELLANYFAISEVLCAYHGLIWHNLRFYYNPITRKLEPIGYDGFTDAGKLRMYNDLFFGEFKSGEGEVAWDDMYKYLYRDPEFNRYYVPALVKYSSYEFIDNLVNQHQLEALNLESIIRNTTDPTYRFGINDIYNRAQKIHKNIAPYNENSLKAFKSPKSNTEIEVSNYHSLPLEIVGTGSNNDGSDIVSSGIIVNSNAKNNPPTYSTMVVGPDDKYVYFKLPNTDKIYHSKIKEWSQPNRALNIEYSSSEKLVVPLRESEYQLINNELIINSGNHFLVEPLIVPSNYKLTFEPGAITDIQKGAYILTYGEFTANGTTTSPILFKSSDKSAQGITVIQSKETCKLSYTSFIDLNTLEENEWQLTGAVTFYESDVDMKNVTISNNLCEDALNIIRASFTIDELNINNTFADGFDCDFCRGTMTNSYLFDTGNDGLDYSGSYIELDNIRLENIGDKGISAGEEATVIVKNTTIIGAKIGIASKDLSKVEVSDVNLTDCLQGFAAYRKKPEFGGATINVKSFTETNVERLINKDDESEILFPK
ncbi:MAG: hypothetical protein ACI9P5_002711 [Saprospiraceae bacterium]|jgi:hypothetical protein